ncbi:MAG: ATP-binding protein [Veillonellaceae bacterium]|nr:ATP-binding protein [Veillonellaceae bacterium]
MLHKITQLLIKQDMLHGQKRVITSLVLFMLGFLALGILMHNHTKTMLYAYMEEQLERQTSIMTDIVNEDISNHLQSLRIAARAIADRPDRTNTIIDYMNKSYPGDIGVMTLDGKLIHGSGDINLNDFEPAINQARHGRAIATAINDASKADILIDDKPVIPGGPPPKSIDAILLAAPIIDNGNVTGIIYWRYRIGKPILPSKMHNGEHNATFFLVNKSGDVIGTFEHITKDEIAKYQKLKESGVTQKLMDQLETRTSAQCHIGSDDMQDYFAVVGEVRPGEIYLAGFIPDDVMLSGLDSIVSRLQQYNILMLLLLIIGILMFFIKEADLIMSARCKERDALNVAKRSASEAREALRKMEDAYDEADEARAAAESANKTKSEFLANMSHEIRTPINAVMGMNEMILRETDNAAAVKEYAQSIESASQTLLSIINDILDFSKIEAGKMEIVPAAYDLSSMLNDIVNMVETKALKKGLAFSIDVDPALPSKLIGDSLRLRQVIVNILSNAVKYTPEGSVSMRLSGISDGKSIKLRFEVADTGIGIREEDIPKLFEGFQRFDLKKNRSIEGTGLGLAITYRLLEQMDGKLDVKSTYGKGSTFIVELAQDIIDSSPIGDFKEKYREFVKSRSEYHETYHMPDAELLVVDDNEMNLLVVKSLLKQTQAKITLCQSGAEALKYIQKQHFDVILLDHMMPEMDGVETLKRAKKLENSKCKDTPFIALTANAIVGMREKYLAAGFDDYLSKPINGHALEKMLEHYVPADNAHVR